MSNTNLVILPKNQPDPLIEIDLTADQLEQIAKETCEWEQTCQKD